MQKEKSQLKCKCSKIHRKKISLMNILQNYIKLINNLILDSLAKKIEFTFANFNTFSISKFFKLRQLKNR